MIIYFDEGGIKMKKDYYFSFDEPILFNKNVICAFYISYIERKRGFFFIVDENNQFALYYSMFNSSEMVTFVKEYKDSMNLGKKVTIMDIVEKPDFSQKFNEKYLKYKVLDNQKYIIKTINKMLKDNIYSANNQSLGLDGFSVVLKLNKGVGNFYAWCMADDKKYFYVIDFINSILDEIKITEKYRFEKLNDKL